MVGTPKITAPPPPTPIPQTNPQALADAANAQRQRFNMPGSRGRADTILFGGLGTPQASTASTALLGVPGAQS